MQGQIQEFKGGGGSSRKRERGPTTNSEQFVLEINKIFSKRGGGEGGRGPDRTPWTPPLPRIYPCLAS